MITRCTAKEDFQSGHRRPIPLNLTSTQNRSSYDEQKPNDSSALQDAAVKSATSLIAVVNDILRSPNPSTQLQPPHHSRPRAYTAPPTPLQEAPTHSLVELPGSFPERPKASQRQYHSFDGNRRTSSALDGHEQRSATTPRRPTHPWLQLPFRRHEQMLAKKRLKESPNQSSDARTSQDSTRSQEARGFPQDARASTDTQPSPWPSEAEMTISHTNQTVTRDVDRSTPSASWEHTDGESPPVDGNAPSMSSDAAQGAHLFFLRRSHEAHLMALKEAHRCEIASYQKYISLLERRQVLSRSNEVRNAPNTRQRSRSSISVHGDSLPTHLQLNTTENSSAFAPTHLSERRASEFHPTLSIPCRSSKGCGEVWLECNSLRAALEASQQQVSKAGETIRVLQASESALQSTAEDLKSRLTDANNQRLDVQEDFHQVCTQVRRLTEREASLVREVDELRERNARLVEASASQGSAAKDTLLARPRHHRAKSDVGHQNTTTGALLAQIAKLENDLLDKDLHIAALSDTYEEDRNPRGIMENHLSTSSRTPSPHSQTPALTAHSPASRPTGSAPSTGSHTLYHPSLSNLSSATNPSPLGITLPTTPRTLPSTTLTHLLATTSPPTTFTNPRTPPLGVHKKLPRPPPSVVEESSPPPAYSPQLRRGETVKSVGGSIIELYGGGMGGRWDGEMEGWV